MRKRKKDRLVGRIGWCSKQTLGLDDGHYVFIRRVYGDKCSVNTFTSLKDKNGNYKYGKFVDFENGKIYPVPTKDLNLKKFSGIHKDVIHNVPLDEVKLKPRFRLKRRHHHYIQKYMKK